MNKLLLNRERAARLTFGFVLLIWVYRYLDHALVHQMQRPPLFITGFDYTYWVFRYLRLPEVLVENKTGAVIFDGCLLVLTVWNLVTAARHRLAVAVCALGWTLYGMIYNSYSCHFNLAVTGVMLLPYAFLARREESFSMVWQGARYFCLYLYADAFIYKALIARNLYYFPMGAEIIKTNQAAFMLKSPASALSPVYSYFITHPALAYAGFAGMVLLEGSMLLGFFTQRWDRFLFFVPILFHAIDYFFVDVFFGDLLILNLTLLPYQASIVSGLSDGAIKRNAVLQTS